jgi:eukaryotic-like serine/threonine-protein kinase
VYATIAELIRDEGTLPAAEVVRWLAEVCDALAALQRDGVSSSVEAGHVKVSRDPAELAVVEPRPFDAKHLPARWQVREVGALGYQMLKGTPPPAQLSDSGFDGIGDELAQLLVAALSGTGPATVAELGQALRDLEPTAQTTRRNSDTVLKARQAGEAKDRSGELFGQYELVQLLGQGGMGDVYLARHVRLAREVAIKLLKPEFAVLPDLVRRFFQEANVVNEIKHPHIVQVLDFIEEPGRVYCVMELLEGRNLADVADDDGPLPLGRIAFIAAQVCDALQAAHVREVVHRDIKPENIFITTGPDGADFAKVLDFGIARRAASGSGTQVGAVMGTPLYMAPEQAAGRAVDARADLYSLGVMLFELLTGRPITEGATGKLPANDASGHEIPKDLKALVEGLMALDPAARPASAEEVRARLLPYVRTTSSGGLMPGLPVRHSQPVSAREVNTRVALAEAGLQRSRLPMVVGAGVVAALAFGLWLAVGPGASAARVEPEVVVKPPPPPPEVKPVEPVVVKPVEPPPEAKPVEPVELPLDPVPDKPVKHGKKKVHKAKVEPAPIAMVKVDSPPAALDTTERVAKLRGRYSALIARHTGEKLTSFERRAIQTALDEAGPNGNKPVAVEVLKDAEAALSKAEDRLK